MRSPGEVTRDVWQVYSDSTYPGDVVEDVAPADQHVVREFGPLREEPPDVDLIREAAQSWDSGESLQPCRGQWRATRCHVWYSHPVTTPP